MENEDNLPDAFELNNDYIENKFGKDYLIKNLKKYIRNQHIVFDEAMKLQRETYMELLNTRKKLALTIFGYSIFILSICLYEVIK